MTATESTGEIIVTRTENPEAGTALLSYEWHGGAVVRLGEPVLRRPVGDGWILQDPPIGTVIHVGPYRLRTIGELDFMTLSVPAVRDNWRAIARALGARTARWLRGHYFAALRHANRQGWAATPDGCVMSWRDLRPPWKWGGR
jgi:hypothetical protein